MLRACEGVRRARVSGDSHCGAFLWTTTHCARLSSWAAEGTTPVHVPRLYRRPPTPLPCAAAMQPTCLIETSPARRLQTALHVHVSTTVGGVAAAAIGMLIATGAAAAGTGGAGTGTASAQLAAGGAAGGGGAAACNCILASAPRQPRTHDGLPHARHAQRHARHTACGTARVMGRAGTPALYRMHIPACRRAREGRLHGGIDGPCTAAVQRGLAHPAGQLEGDAS